MYRPIPQNHPAMSMSNDAEENSDAVSHACQGRSCLTMHMGLQLIEPGTLSVTLNCWDCDLARKERYSPLLGVHPSKRKKSQRNTHEVLADELSVVCQSRTHSRSPLSRLATVSKSVRCCARACSEVSQQHLESVKTERITGCDWESTGKRGILPVSTTERLICLRYPRRRTTRTIIRPWW